jgi:hypothetical protein
LDVDPPSPTGYFSCELDRHGRSYAGYKEVPVMGITLTGEPIYSKRDITFFLPLPSRRAGRALTRRRGDSNGAGFHRKLRLPEESCVTPEVLLLALVTAERLAELWLARRNTAALLAKGAYEVAPGHYPLIVLLHALWLSGLRLIGRAHPLSGYWLVIFMALQVLRVWVLLTLRRRWTTRIIVLPGAPLVANGPYRLLSHPN